MGTTQEASPSCSSADAALCPAPKLPGIIRQPRAGPESSTLTTRTNLRAYLCFCNGHLTPCESWLCSCSCSFRPVISCALETRAIVSTAFLLSLSLAGGRCDGNGGRYLATALPTQDSPRETSIDLPCLPSGITTPNRHLHNGAHKTNYPPPNPPALYTRLPAPIRVAVKVLSHGSPTLTHATTTSYGGHGLPCCHPIRPAYLLHFLLECVRYLIHPRRSLCHDTPSANQSRSSPDEGVILKQYYQKQRLQENLLSCKSESCRATLGGRQFLSCLAQPRPKL